MSGLDAFFNFSVDGYRSPNGEITTAKKKIWFTEPPKNLTFILQRVQYDKDKGSEFCQIYFDNLLKWSTIHDLKFII